MRATSRYQEGAKQDTAAALMLRPQQQRKQISGADDNVDAFLRILPSDASQSGSHNLLVQIPEEVCDAVPILILPVERDTVRHARAA